MQMQADHDFHLHTFLSACSADPEQTVNRLIAYGRENGLRHLCITDHFWDALVPGASDWYRRQDLPHLQRSLPLPSCPDIQLSFGCEADMDQYGRLGVAPEHFPCFDFLNIALTHLHMSGFTRPAAQTDPRQRAVWILRRMDVLLSMALPFHRVGLAHLTTPHLGRDVPGGHVAVLSCISEDDWLPRMRRAARLGCGIELNACAVSDLEPVLRPYRIAKDCGCRFYLGSDAHHPQALTTAVGSFRTMIRLLALTEEDRFHLAV